MDMTQFKVTASHKTEPIRIALAAATEDDAAGKAAQLWKAGYWQNVEVVPFVPVFKSKVAR
jgi:hypothetical protein